MEFVSANSDDARVKEIQELKERIMDKLIELMREKNVPAEILFNSLVNVTVQMATFASGGDKDKLVHIANELRYSIIGQIK